MLGAKLDADRRPFSGLDASGQREFTERRIELSLKINFLFSGREPYHGARVAKRDRATHPDAAGDGDEHRTGNHRSVGGEQKRLLNLKFRQREIALERLACGAPALELELSGSRRFSRAR